MRRPVLQAGVGQKACEVQTCYDKEKVSKAMAQDALAESHLRPRRLRDRH